MSQEIYSLIAGEAEKREDQAFLARANEMADVYEGKLPARFDKFFPRNTPRQQINLIRSAWDDLATQAGRIPEFRMDTLNETAAELKRAGLSEKIAHSYLRNAEPSAQSFMYELAWWTLGIGRGVIVIKPDFDKKRPEIQLRDPRTALPRAKKISGGTITELADIIFKYEIPSSTARAMGLAPGNDDGPDAMTTIVELLDENTWTLVSEGGTLQRLEHNLGVVPAVVPQTFSPNGKTGLGLFDDQVSLVVSLSRLLSQKMAFADRLTNPITWVKGHEGDINIGPTTVMRLSANGAIGQLQPTTTLQVDQDIAQLERFSRIMNRNPELRSGEVQGRGTYVSAKTLEQLSEAIDTVIGRYWDVIGNAMSKAIEICFRMDERLWPDEEKSVTGNIKGKRFSDKYIPSKDIAGNYFIRADYGFGMGGYQGFLMHVQANGSDLMSRRRAIESMPGVSDVDEELRTIELEKMDEAGNTAFQQAAASGGLDLAMWAKMREEMARKRIPLHETILKYEDALKQQAQEAAQAQGNVQALTTAPAGAPPEAAPADPAGVPGALFG